MSQVIFHCKKTIGKRGSTFFNIQFITTVNRRLVTPNGGLVREVSPKMAFNIQVKDL